MTRIVISVDCAQTLLDLANWIASEKFHHDSEFDNLDHAEKVLRDIVKRSQGKATR